VRRHNHRDRSLAQFPPGSLEPDAVRLKDGDALPRVSVKELTAAQFAERFSGRQLPAMILGAAEGWPAVERWSSQETMLEHYGAIPFKVSEMYPPHAAARPLKVELPLSLYVENAASVGADFPFYVFERDLEGPRAPLLNDFEVPSYFRDDLYNVTEYTRAFFPLYRYIIVGVERTGSNLHVDPSCTSAWNTLLCGLKRWALFPPGDSDEYRQRIGAVPRSGEGGGAPPAYWWLDVLPRLRESGEDKELGLIECVQRPGETIFVPSGWWHCVLNVGFTAAVTQNLVPPETLPFVWDGLEKGWPDFARVFGELLEELRPDVPLPAGAQRSAKPQQAERPCSYVASEPISIPCAS